MYLVGLTGGIGSGKSAAAERFREHHVTVINADLIAREVVEPGTLALTAIAEKFGPDVIQSDGSLDRTALRHTIFDNDEHRLWLENLLHPLIGEATDQRRDAPRCEGEAPYRVLESPLLLEVGGQHRVDRVLLIDADLEVRVQRIIERDDSNREQAMAIIETQMPADQKRELADDVIDNSASLTALYQQVDQLHRNYCERAEQWQAGQARSKTR